MSLPFLLYFCQFLFPTSQLCKFHFLNLILQFIYVFLTKWYIQMNFSLHFCKQQCGIVIKFLIHSFCASKLFRIKLLLHMYVCAHARNPFSRMRMCGARMHSYLRACDRKERMRVSTRTRLHTSHVWTHNVVPSFFPLSHIVTYRFTRL